VNVAVVIAGVVPSPDSSGSALTVWTIVRYLLEQRHGVGVVVLLDKAHEDPGTGFDQRLADLRALGVEVRVVSSRSGELYERMNVDLRSRLGRIWRPSDEELFPALTDARSVAAAVAELAPDVAYVYGWEAVAATRTLRARIPRFATVVDPPHLSLLYRWRARPSRLGRDAITGLIRLQGRLRHQPRLMVELLNECEASANLAAHHAAWLRKRGAAGCEYLRTPVEDRPGSGWRDARERRSDNRPRLLLIGHLRGISTQDGLDLFAESVLPRLEAALGPDGFEARLAGGYEAPLDLRAALDRPSVRFLGHLRQPDEEFSAAVGLVVPTSIPLGTRVRIISAFSFGCPVVAHEANAKGIPELSDGDNVLLGRSGAELADGFVHLVRDAELRERLGTRGRETYERFFAPPIAGARVEDTLRRISLARRRPSDPASVAA